MAKFNVAREDVDALTLELVDHLLSRFPSLAVVEMNEDVLFDQIEEVVDKFFDSPDYRNYN